MLVDTNIILTSCIACYQVFCVFIEKLQFWRYISEADPHLLIRIRSTTWMTKVAMTRITVWIAPNVPIASVPTFHPSVPKLEVGKWGFIQKTKKKNRHGRWFQSFRAPEIIKIKDQIFLIWTKSSGGSCSLKAPSPPKKKRRGHLQICIEVGLICFNFPLLQDAKRAKSQVLPQVLRRTSNVPLFEENT